MDGAMSRPRPCCSPVRPEITPVVPGLTCRLYDTQAISSCLRAMLRSMLNPQSGLSGSKFSVLNGMANSATQPASSIRVSACQMPSQSAFTSVGVSNTASSRLPFGFT